MQYVSKDTFENLLWNTKHARIDDLQEAGFFIKTPEKWTGTNHNTYEFESSSDFVKYVESIPAEGTVAYKEFNRCASIVGDEGFTMSRSFEHAIELFYRPSPEEIQKIRDLTEQITKEENFSGYISGDKIIEFDVTGDYLDIGAYMEGVPEVFGSISDTKDVGKYVEIIIEYTGVSGMVTTEEIMHAITTLISLIQKLEEMKYRVKLHYVEVSQCNFIHMILKDYIHKTSVADLVATMHPSFFRRILFRAIENSPNFQEGYGSSDYALRYDGELFKKPFVYRVGDLINHQSDKEKIKFISKELDKIMT